MNVLSIERIAYRYAIEGVEQPEPHWQAEFVVDGERLSEAFEFEGGRPWFGSTCFEVVESARDALVRELRGLEPARNQFGTGRFVLYRCHCGVDYCGVISCAIDRDGDRVIWRDVRFEGDDEDDEPLSERVVEEWAFEASAYDACVAGYVASLG